jgi:hypothetical protein
MAGNVATGRILDYPGEQSGTAVWRANLRIQTIFRCRSQNALQLQPIAPENDLKSSGI